MEKTIVKMTDSLEMLGFIKSNGTSCRFVSITTKTPVVKIRSGNPWNAGKSTQRGLYKVSKRLGLINANYNASVRRRIAERLGVELSDVSYESGEVWYQHLTTVDGKSLPIVQHKDESKREGYYLQFFPHKSENAYVDETGEVVDEATVSKWLYKESERPDYKPSVISVKLANIAQLKASGVVIEMPEFAEAEAILGA